MANKKEIMNSVAVSWLVTSITLLIYAIEELISDKKFGILSIVFFISQGVYWLSYIFFLIRRERSISI